MLVGQMESSISLNCCQPTRISLKCEYRYEMLKINICFKFSLLGFKCQGKFQQFYQMVIQSSTGGFSFQDQQSFLKSKCCPNILFNYYTYIYLTYPSENVLQLDGVGPLYNRPSTAETP